MSKPRRARGDRGAAAVEFGLLLPFLAMLVCGTIDLGRWYSAWNETKNAAREGALYGQAFPNQQDDYGGVCASPNNIKARTRQELGFSPTDTSFVITVSHKLPTEDDTQWSTSGAGCPPASDPVALGEEIRVQVTRDLPLITPIVSNLLNGVKIKAQVTATVLG